MSFAISGYQQEVVRCMITHMRARLHIPAVVSVILAMSFGVTTSADEFWSLDSAIDDNSGEAVAFLRQESRESIRDESGKNSLYPVFEFRCIPSRDPGIRFQIDWRRFISSFNTEVGFRVDGGKALWLKLGVDQTNRITLSKSSKDVNKLIQLFGDATTVELEIAPYSEPSVFVRFDISSFNSAVETLNERCI